MRLLVIDNYDSFTYNLVQYFGELGAECEVLRNDAKNLEQITIDEYQGLVLSPGPCDPDKAGICLDLIAAAAAHRIPLLGVCLGHQAIGQSFGGRVVRAPTLMHGKMSNIHHGGKSIFQHLPSPIEATRYHSLIVERETLPDCLEITAWTTDGIIMGMQHKELPVHGVQFHPESIASEHGHDLLRNFLQLAGMNVREFV